MFASLLPALVPLAVRLIAYAFEKHYLNVEQKKAFLDFIHVMGQKENSSKKSSDVFKELHEKLKIKTH
ncbi:hypothetical protein [Caudoviricetes sp.]|nr:hypothetical protein [Caudoviricetes sp.]